MLHSSIAMVSSSALAHLNWGSILAGLQSVAVAVMEVQHAVFV